MEGLKGLTEIVEGTLELTLLKGRAGPRQWGVATLMVKGVVVLRTTGL